MKPKPKTTLKQLRAARKRAVLKADIEWALAVKERDGFACQKCGRTTNLNSHHIFSKKAHPATRHDLENGICLCAGCHLWWAHKEGAEFTLWLIGRMGKRGLDALERRANGSRKQTGA